jgi:hypothetical protein
MGQIPFERKLQMKSLLALAAILIGVVAVMDGSTGNASKNGKGEKM